MKLAIYDFDGTLCEEETIPFLIAFYRKNNYSYRKLGKFYLKMLGATAKYISRIDASFDKEKYRETAAKNFMILFEEMKKEEIISFFAASASELAKSFNPMVVASIEERKADDYHIVLCSGANTLLLNEVAQYIPIDTIIGTELHFLEDGTYDFNSELFVTTGKNKPIVLLDRFMNKNIDWQNSCAYGDSFYDYDILKLTGTPVAVNPDKGLREIATENGWDVLEEK